MDGKVTGGLGPMDPKAMVDLEMSSATFDGMMTGEVDGALRSHVRLICPFQVI